MEASGQFYAYCKIHKVLTCPPLLRAICGLNRHGRPLSRKIWYLGTSRGNPAESVTKPSILASNVSITEEGPVAMTCLSGDTGISITWIFSNQTLQLTDRMQLSRTTGPSA
ncbi:Hypothetical predicted protein [Marmota monax]|uniref:Ig-like domain-containing protein n=1 Tax=Marmota monax TaxID=9995 RepID=A0A5E4ACZ4_MARMO|nr:hypothetical protein GHT09_004327 [Marmota monax]VTJ54899.1 Hypothetical predicted protein [Marmota monax]